MAAAEISGIGRKKGARSHPRPTETTESANLHSTAAILGGGPQLPGAPGLEQIRIHDLAQQCVGMGPVVVQPLPDMADRPRIALCRLGVAIADLVDVEILDMHTAHISARRSVKSRAAARRASGGSAQCSLTRTLGMPPTVGDWGD